MELTERVIDLEASLINTHKCKRINIYMSNVIWSQMILTTGYSVF